MPGPPGQKLIGAGLALKKLGDPSSPLLFLCINDQLSAQNASGAQFGANQPQRASSTSHNSFSKVFISLECVPVMVSCGTDETCLFRSRAFNKTVLPIQWKKKVERKKAVVIPLAK